MDVTSEEICDLVQGPHHELSLNPMPTGHPTTTFLQQSVLSSNSTQDPVSNSLFSLFWSPQDYASFIVALNNFIIYYFPVKSDSYS